MKRILCLLCSIQCLYAMSNVESLVMNRSEKYLMDQDMGRCVGHLTREYFNYKQYVPLLLSRGCKQSQFTKHDGSDSEKLKSHLQLLPTISGKNEFYCIVQYHSPVTYIKRNG